MIVSINAHNPFRTKGSGRMPEFPSKIWPASHGVDISEIANVTPVSPIQAGTVALFQKLGGPNQKLLEHQKAGYFLYRVIGTIAHEVGHSINVAHCVKYACLMVAGSSQPSRDEHPPYFCPECLEKLLYSVAERKMDEYERLPSWKSLSILAIERYGKLLEFCIKRDDNPAFAPYAAWLRGILQMSGSPKYVKAVLARIGICYDV